MNKGERTRNEILKQSIKHASRFGLADITIGTVSKLCQLSRTGVISHFKNKEDMQIAILNYGEELFIERVIRPSWREDPLDHLAAFLDSCMNWTIEMFDEYQVSCPFIKAVAEFQNRPDSEVRAFTIVQQNRLVSYITRRVQRCFEHGRFTSDTDSETIAYELYSLYLGHALTKHTVSASRSDDMFKKCVARLLKRYQTPD